MFMPFVFFVFMLKTLIIFYITIYNRTTISFQVEEASIPDKDENEDEAAGDEQLMVEMEGTEKEAAELLEEELEMEVEEEGKGEEGGDGTLRALGDIYFLTKKAEPSGKTIIDDRNRSNNLIRLEML